MWVFMGDFNAVRRRDERINSNFFCITALDFNKFIKYGGLHELKMGGFKFTYYQNAGAKLIKLDMILVCPEFVSKFPQASCTALPREQSDHCPIFLELSSMDYGPIPFRLFNSWILRP